jgi:hypothetical protein
MPFQSIRAGQGHVDNYQGILCDILSDKFNVVLLPKIKTPKKNSVKLKNCQVKKTCCLESVERLEAEPLACGLRPGWPSARSSKPFEFKSNVPDFLSKRINK